MAVCTELKCLCDVYNGDMGDANDYFPILILNALCAFLLFLNLCFFIFNLLFLNTDVIIISVTLDSETGSTFSMTCSMIPVLCGWYVGV